MIPARTEAIPKLNVFLNTHFRIEPCSSCFIAGYLIVSPRVRVSSLAELSPDAQATLGATLAAGTRAIEGVVRPRRVYCALLADEPNRFTKWFLDPKFPGIHPNALKDFRDSWQIFER